MKIVISGYVGRKITGIGRTLVNLLNASQSGNQYIVYTNFDMKDDMVFTNPNITVKTYNISKLSSLKNLIWTTFVFPFIVIKENADRALIPNFTLLLFKFKPTLVIIHDLIEFNVPNKFSKKKMFYRTKLANPITAKQANHIITISKNSQKDIENFLFVKKEKISVVNCGVDQNKFKRMSIERAQSILKTRAWPYEFLLYVGTVDHPGKNAITLIKAYTKLRYEGKIIDKLIIAGMPGKGFEFVDEYVKQSKYKNDIIFTGFISDEELIALYSQCSVFCFISLYEGFGIPPLEAMACGAKVVVSDTSSLPEVVGNLGSLVNPLDVDAVCNAILFEKSREYNDIYYEKIQQHLKKYDWIEISKQFETALQKG